MGHAYRTNKGVLDAKAVNSPTLLIINLCDSRALRVMMSRSLVLAMFLLALPSLFTMMRSVSSITSLDEINYMSKGNSFKIFLPVLLRDLLDEGLIRKGDKGYIFVADSNKSDTEDEFEFLKGAGVDLLVGSNNDQVHQDDKKQVVDFVFTSSFNGIDPAVKDDGLVLTTLGHDPSSVLKFLAHYKIVYLRRFENNKTVVALRKVKEPSNNNLASSSAAKRVLCGVAHASPEEKKRAALKRLEDVYLEPPRRAPRKASRSPKFAPRKFKFLPNLMKDSLDGYPRRFFITDDSKAVEWFHVHYPTKDQEFEVRNLETTTMNDNENKNNKGVVSGWIKENVRREDYVVMKAEARVVEEMVKDKSLSLVDELFLECENKWSDGDESKRAYWQCLELYGKVKDQGIAVHQWWD